jgi:DNA polymerase-3 subunit alpha
LQEQLIARLQQLFKASRGEHSVMFEVMELEKVKRQVEILSTVNEPAEDYGDAALPEEEISETVVADVDDVQVVTKLTMPSRKLKVNISNELLYELDKMQLNFKLN